MSAVVLDNNKNIGSAYKSADGMFVWSVVIMRGSACDFRRGKQRDEMTARYAMVAGAREMGVENPVLLEL